MSTLLLIIIIIITYIIQFEKNLITNYLMITILLSIYFFIKNAVLISFINIIITISTVTILTIINHYDINYFEVKNKYMIFKYLFIINIIAIYIYILNIFDFKISSEKNKIIHNITYYEFINNSKLSIGNILLNDYIIVTEIISLIILMIIIFIILFIKD